MTVNRKHIYRRRDRLKQMRAFCVAGRLGSFAQAANHLGINPPSVSLHVRELENEFRVPLFDRSGSGIVLTGAGCRLLEHAEPLVQRLDRLCDEFFVQLDNTTGETLQLAASVAGAAFVLPPYVGRLTKLCPDVRLQVRRCVLHEGLNLLLDDEVELVLEAKDSYPQNSVTYHHILSYDVVLITCVDHPLSGRQTVSPREARAWPAIVPGPGTFNRHIEDQLAREFRVNGNAAIEVEGWGVIKRYVENGLGVSIVPSICVGKSDRLVSIPLREHFPTRSYGVFTRRNRYVSRSARQLLRLMVPDATAGVKMS